MMVERPRSAARFATVFFIVVLAGAANGCGGAQSTAVETPIAEPARWPMFRGEPTHRGDFRNAPTPKGVVRWRRKVGERIDASALIDGLGRVVVATREGDVAVLAAADGAIEATASLGAGVWATPAIVGDTVVVAAKDGRLHGLGGRSLVTRWRLAIGDGAFSGMTVTEGRILVCAGDAVVAVDGAAGQTPVIVWNRKLEGHCYTAPVVAQALGALFVGDRTGTVTALALEDGAVLWRNAATPGVAVDGSGAVDESAVFFGGNDRSLRAYELRDGSILFSVVGAAWVVSTPAIVDGAVVYGDDDGAVRSIAVDGTRQLWQAQVGGDVASAPTRVGDLIVHAAHDGYLYARDPNSGGLAFKLRLGAAAYASVAVQPDGGVVITTHGGEVLFID